MKTNRPIIDVPVEPMDLIIDLVSVTLLIIMMGYTLYAFPGLPDTIPIHYNGSGEVDGYGIKTTIWLLPVISIVMFVGLFILNKYPHMHNYMVNITEENALKNYRFSTRILRVVNFLCMLLFAFIQYRMILGAHRTTTGLGDLLLPIIIGSSILLPIVLFYYQNKLNKE